MSKKVTIDVEICSNCKAHAWCTRHSEKKYESIFEEIKKAVEEKDHNITVQKHLVGDKKMGAFEISSEGHLLFSKLSSSYFPHTLSVTEKIISFANDSRNGKDLKTYDVNNEKSEWKVGFRPNQSKSPMHKTMINSGKKDDANLVRSEVINSPPKHPAKSDSHTQVQNKETKDTKEHKDAAVKESAKKDQKKESHVPKEETKKEEKKQTEPSKKTQQKESKIDNEKKSKPTEEKAHDKTETKQDTRKSDIAASDKKIPPKQGSKDAPKEAPKDAPKEGSKQVPKEKVNEAPKQAPKEKPKQEPKKQIPLKKETVNATDNKPQNKLQGAPATEPPTHKYWEANLKGGAFQLKENEPSKV